MFGYLYILCFIPLSSVAAGLFDFPWYDLSLNGLFKRAVQPTPKQCALVAPPPVFKISPGGQNGGGSDQSPPLPGPSETEPGTIRAQSACGAIGATGMFDFPSTFMSKSVLKVLNILRNDYTSFGS